MQECGRRPGLHVVNAGLCVWGKCNCVSSLSNVWPACKPWNSYRLQGAMHCLPLFGWPIIKLNTMEVTLKRGERAGEESVLHYTGQYHTYLHKYRGMVTKSCEERIWGAVMGVAPSPYPSRTPTPFVFWGFTNYYATQHFNHWLTGSEQYIIILFI